MKISCTPLSLPIVEPTDVQYVLFGRSSVPTIGTAGPTLPEDFSALGVYPSSRAWDLLAIAVAVAAADEGALRARSSDGWTRQLELQIAVQDPDFWRSQQRLIEGILRFLTDDVWSLEFVTGGHAAPKPPPKLLRPRNDSVCLLSGGADSLAGAIDVRAAGRRPMLVSQVSRGDKDVQKLFAARLVGPAHHVQLNHNIHSPGLSERSQRARSLIFITYGVAVATSLEPYVQGGCITLYVPENGFIGINIPLTPLRLGSLSTRTTHPYYMGMFQKLLNAAGLRVNLENPYRFKTKGEVLKECRDQKTLEDLVFQSTSCGRFARTGFMHCGRCVPCLVRRSSILAWGRNDKTEYKYADLALEDEHHRKFDDVRSACFAVHQVRTQGLDKWVGGALSSTQLGDISQYKALLSRGIDELSAFLTRVRAL